MERSETTEDRRYLIVLDCVRGLSEGWLKVERQVPIHIGYIPNEVKPKPRPLNIVPSRCDCPEVFMETQFEKSRICILDDPQATHDCQYCEERNRYLRKHTQGIYEKARMMAAEKADRFSEAAVLASAYAGIMLTDVMNRFDYENRLKERK